MRQKHVPLSHIAKVMMPGIYYSYAEFSLLTGIGVRSVSNRAATMVNEGLIKKGKHGRFSTLSATPQQIEKMKALSEVNEFKRGKRNPDKPPTPRITRSNLDILLFSTAIV